jgi:hypothetical protein
MKHIITGLLLTLMSTVGWGESIYQYDCTFPYFSDEKEAKQTQENDYTGVYIVTIEDDGNYSGVLSGGAGAASLIVVPGNGLINLFEITPSAVVNITTLQPDFAQSTAKAVHSRHAALPDYDYWYPTQFYGTCTIK